MRWPFWERTTPMLAFDASISTTNCFIKSGRVSTRVVEKACFKNLKGRLRLWCLDERIILQHIHKRKGYEAKIKDKFLIVSSKAKEATMTPNVGRFYPIMDALYFFGVNSYPLGRDCMFQVINRVGAKNTFGMLQFPGIFFEHHEELCQMG